jgi:hypothetical protein
MSSPNKHPNRTVFFVVAFVFAVVLAGMSLLSQTAAAQSGQPDGTTPFGTLPPVLDAEITFIHAAPVFSDTLATAIDVCNEAGKIVDGLQGVVYGQSRTFSTDAGTFDWKIAVASSGCGTLVKDIPPFQIGFGGSGIVIAIGDAVNQPLDVLVIIPSQGGGNHYLPFVGKNVGAP